MAQGRGRAARRAGRIVAAAAGISRPLGAGEGAGRTSRSVRIPWTCCRCSCCLLGETTLRALTFHAPSLSWSHGGHGMKHIEDCVSSWPTPPQCLTPTAMTILGPRGRDAIRHSTDPSPGDRSARRRTTASPIGAGVLALCAPPHLSPSRGCEHTMRSVSRLSCCVLCSYPSLEPPVSE